VNVSGAIHDQPPGHSLDPPLLLLSNKVDIIRLHTTIASEQQVGFDESEVETINAVKRFSKAGIWHDEAGLCTPMTKRS